MKKVIPLDKQTIFDIALQEYGTVESVDIIIADNVHVSLTELKASGDPILIRRDFIADQKLRNIFQKIRPIS